MVIGGVLALDAMGQRLFAAHMSQHLLLIALAAPLLVLGGLEVRLTPAWAWSLFVGVFLFWHWPAAFQWAAGAPATRLLELASILFSALLFWSGALTTPRFNNKLALSWAAEVTEGFIVEARKVDEVRARWLNRSLIAGGVGAISVLAAAGMNLADKWEGRADHPVPTVTTLEGPSTH